MINHKIFKIKRKHYRKAVNGGWNKEGKQKIRAGIDQATIKEIKDILDFSEKDDFF